MSGCIIYDTKQTRAAGLAAGYGLSVPNHNPRNLCDTHATWYESFALLFALNMNIRLIKPPICFFFFFVFWIPKELAACNCSPAATPSSCTVGLVASACPPYSLLTMLPVDDVIYIRGTFDFNIWLLLSGSTPNDFFTLSDVLDRPW